MRRPDRYQLIRKIVGDPFGSVFLANDLDKNRHVFFQRIEQSGKVVDIQAGRYLARARAISRIQSDFVLPVLEVGEAENMRFVVLAYLEGVTLGHHMKSSLLLPAERIRISLEILQALQAAHTNGAVHGNLHPERILLDTAGTVKMAFIGEPAWFAGAPNIRTSPEAGFSAEAFKAPECRGGTAPDPRSDFYSAGRIIQEIFHAASTREAAGEKQDSLAIMEKKNLWGARLAEFKHLIDHAVEEDRDKRIQDISPLVEELLFLRARDKVEQKKDTFSFPGGFQWQELIPWKLILMVCTFLFLLLVAYFLYRSTL